MKRLFIAVDISESARNVAAKHIGSLRSEFSELRVGWERPEKLHITLKFLGRTAEDLMPAISAKLDHIAMEHEVFPLAMTGKGVFPSARKPRVLWLGVDDREAKLAGLASDVIEAMARLGFEPEKRKFAAHLTIARIKQPETGRPLAERHLQMQYEPVEFEVEDIVLYESQLRPTGSVYTKLGLFKLRA